MTASDHDPRGGEKPEAQGTLGKHRVEISDEEILALELSTLAIGGVRTTEQTRRRLQDKIAALLARAEGQQDMDTVREIGVKGCPFSDPDIGYKLGLLVGTIEHIKSLLRGTVFGAQTGRRDYRALPTVVLSDKS